MTEENYRYRTNPLFLRNQFTETGKYGIPLLPKSSFRKEDLEDICFIAFNQINRDSGFHKDRLVHFFLYDYEFEKVWKRPEPYLSLLKPYRGVLTPDFSMYLEMPAALQLYNTFRNRWCGAYFAQHGLPVIPTVNWGKEESFDFCFEGIPKGSVVAVSTCMVSEHGNHRDQKEFFLNGYKEMLRRIEPEAILCYHWPFPEMDGNIVTVSYESSSWQSLREEKDIGGRVNHDIMVRKQGFVQSSWQEKGSGSAYGGGWKPAKPEDERLVGKPGEIHYTLDRNGNRQETKIGKDGLAVSERHYSNHGNSSKHSIPHDHTITWVNNHPNWGAPTNYWDGNIPDFKAYGGSNMKQYIQQLNSLEENRFKTISEFKDCLQRGGEIEMEWKGVHFGIIRYGENQKITAYLWDQEGTDEVFDSADGALEYRVAGDRLRDVITQVNVLNRSI